MSKIYYKFLFESSNTHVLLLTLHPPTLLNKNKLPLFSLHTSIITTYEYYLLPYSTM